MCDHEGKDSGATAENEDVDDSFHVIDRDDVAVAHGTKR